MKPRHDNRCAGSRATAATRGSAGPRRLLLAAVALLVVFVSACGGGSGSSSGGGSTGASSGGARDGGTLRIGFFAGEVDGINPFTAINLYSWATFTTIYPQLVQYDEQMRIAPDFAESWRHSDDGKTITFKTVAGARWSDGQPLTADDVVWTIETAMTFKDGAAAQYARGVNGIARVAAPDPTTVVITYREPTATALAQLQTVWILPRHVWAEHAAGDGRGLREYANPTPVVSGGPFTLEKFVRNEVALLRRNPNYYGEPAHIDGYGLRQFTNADAMVTAVKNGEIDVAIDPPAVTVKNLEADPKLRVEQRAGYVWDALGFNSNADNPGQPELREPDVRKAIALSLDVEQLIEIARDGIAERLATQVPDGEWRDESLKPFPHDPAEANRILDGLGYERGSDGVRVADGKRMSYRLIVANLMTDAKRITQLFDQYLEEIGIEIKPEIVDISKYWTTVTGPDSTYGTSDILFLTNWSNYPDPDWILSLMTCRERGGLNETGYCNPEYDRLYDRQRVEIDEPERMRTVGEMQAILYRDLPYVPLFQGIDKAAWRNTWGGTELLPGGFLSALSKRPLLDVHLSR